jgi:hypothetical protein
VRMEVLEGLDKEEDTGPLNSRRTVEDRRALSVDALRMGGR